MTMGGIEARVQCVLPLQCRAEQAAVGGLIPARLVCCRGVFLYNTVCAACVYICPACEGLLQAGSSSLAASILLCFRPSEGFVPQGLVPVTSGAVCSHARTPLYICSVRAAVDAVGVCSQCLRVVATRMQSCMRGF